MYILFSGLIGSCSTWSWSLCHVMSLYKILKTTGLGEKLGQLTREDKKIKLINKGNNVYFLHFVKKWYKGVKEQLYRVIFPLKVIIHYDKQRLYGLLDTGSNVSLINYSLVENKEEIIPVRSSLIKCANGTKSKAKGEILLKIKIKGYTYEINALVLESATFNILLGNNFLFKYGLIIDYRKNEITFKSGDIIKMDPLWLDYWDQD